MIEKPQLLKTIEQEIAFIPITISQDQVQEVMGPGYQELMDALSEQGVEPAGPWLNHHLRMDPEIFDFRLSVPISSPILPSGRVESGLLPAATVARTVYQGPYEGLPQAWGEFDQWILSRGLEKRSDLWECYELGPETNPDPSFWRTELNQPILESA
jgi:effector-binding domain-containing protein